MNPALENLFDECAAAPGLLGCGARLADRTCLIRSHHQSSTNELLEKSLHHLADATGLFAGHGLASTSFAWTFADGKLFAATRPDGALISLVTRADVDAGEFFGQIAAKFLALA